MWTNALSGQGADGECLSLTLWRLRERPLSGVSQSLFWGIAASTLARSTDGRRRLGGEFLPKS